jgi:tRNA threonylcarbamoyladenosine biosynthesis protein TsaE
MKKKYRDIQQAAEELISNLNFPCVFLLYGEMGSGKTTLTRTIGSHLTFEKQVQSPTYNLKLDYKGEYNNKEFDICHLDLYRLPSNAEIHDLVLEETIMNRLWIVEWPERTKFDWYSIADKVFKIIIKVTKNHNREFFIYDEKVNH